MLKYFLRWYIRFDKERHHLSTMGVSSINFNHHWLSGLFQLPMANWLLTEAVLSLLWPDIVFPFDKIIIACGSLLTSPPSQAPYYIIIIIIGTRLHVWNLIFSGIYKTLQPVLTRVGDDSNYHTICMTFMFIFALYSLPGGNREYFAQPLCSFGPVEKSKRSQPASAQVDFDFDSCLPDSLHWAASLFAFWLDSHFISSLWTTYGQAGPTADRGAPSDPHPWFRPFGRPTAKQLSRLASNTIPSNGAI